MFHCPRDSLSADFEMNEKHCQELEAELEEKEDAANKAVAKAEDDLATSKAFAAELSERIAAGDKSTRLKRGLSRQLDGFLFCWICTYTTYSSSAWFFSQSQ